MFLCDVARVCTDVFMCSRAKKKKKKDMRQKFDSSRKVSWLKTTST